MNARGTFVIVAALACLVTVSTAAATSATQPFKLTSTLDGKTVLPHRIHWLAFPRMFLFIPYDGLASVDLINAPRPHQLRHPARLLLSKLVVAPSAPATILAAQHRTAVRLNAISIRRGSSATSKAAPRPASRSLVYLGSMSQFHQKATATSDW